MKFYATWSKGLAESSEALGLLRREGIAGVETCNTDGEVDRILDAGLEVSCHNPFLEHREYALNLADPGLPKIFDGEYGRRLLEVMRNSARVSVHCGYSATRIRKDHGFQDVTAMSEHVNDREELIARFAAGLKCLKEAVNGGQDGQGGESEETRIDMENLCIQGDNPMLRRLPGSDLNAGKSYVTEPGFVGRVLRTADVMYVFDVPHCLVTANTMMLRHNDGCYGEEEYVDAMIEAGRGRVCQLHLNMPAGEADSGYCDFHLPLAGGDCRTERVMDIAAEVLRQNEGMVEAVTPEIYASGEPGKWVSPIEHAEKTLEQRDYIAGRLGL